MTDDKDDLLALLLAVEEVTGGRGRGWAGEGEQQKEGKDVHLKKSERGVETT